MGCIQSIIGENEMAIKESKNIVPIGSKEIGKYITACFFALGQHKEIKIIARGGNIKRALDILEILKRDWLEDPKYDIKIGTERHEERGVTTIEITLSGTKKNKE